MMRFRRVRSGFTLIELLVVIAIIAILIGLLVPAVQKVREAAARATCQNNLKQWGLAIHNHQTTLKTIPPGATSSPRHTFVIHLWPYFEQQALANLYNPTLHFYQPPNIVQNATTGACAQLVPMYFCPSDRGSAHWKGDSYWRSRGNYVVNWGPITRPWTGGTTPTALAPFGWLADNPVNPQKVRITDFRDGTSNTLLMSEILMARNDTDFDTRGDFLNDDANFVDFQFMTINTPNGGSDVTSTCITGDTAMPCSGGSPMHQAARSRHTGGVNVLLADGSVRFVASTIDLATWRGLSTMNGGEILNDY